MTRIERVDGKPTLVPVLDLSWVPDGWWRLLTDEPRREGIPDRVNRRHFEACVFSQLMLELKAGDLCIDRTARRDARNARSCRRCWPLAEAAAGVVSRRAGPRP